MIRGRGQRPSCTGDEATGADTIRLGDSMTNPITPLLAYFPLIVITAQRFVPQAGIGSLVALMLPCSIWFGISSTIMFALWFMAELPLGSEAPGSAAGL
ncbi:MAG: AbgT family transporter [Alphaproteobacteria bacterium]